jgi:hypothetical protein
MNKITNIIYAGVAGTTGMTLFSYIVSKKKNKNFKEPQLLGQLINRSTSLSNSSKIAGWLLHYMAGILFAVIYSGLLNNTKMKNRLPESLITGGVSGIAAVCIWHTVFKLHPLPPLVARRKYYGHLIATHILFGAVTFSCLNGNCKS